MRRVVLMMSTSIDGFVAGPRGHAGTHITGRVTYEEMAAHWLSLDTRGGSCGRLVRRF